MSQCRAIENGSWEHDLYLKLDKFFEFCLSSDLYIPQPGVLWQQPSDPSCVEALLSHSTSPLVFLLPCVIFLLSFLSSGSSSCCLMFVLFIFFPFFVSPNYLLVPRSLHATN